MTPTKSCSCVFWREYKFSAETGQQISFYVFTSRFIARRRFLQGVNIKESLLTPKVLISTPLTEAYQQRPREVSPASPARNEQLAL